MIICNQLPLIVLFFNQLSLSMSINPFIDSLWELEFENLYRYPFQAKKNINEHSISFLLSVVSFTGKEYWLWVLCCIRNRTRAQKKH